MNLKSIIERELFQFSIFWNLTDFYGGKFVEPFLGLPLFFLNRLIYSFSKDLFYIEFIIFSGIIFAATFVGLKILSLERYYRITTPKIWGLLIALVFIKSKFFTICFLTLIYSFMYNFFWNFFQKTDFVNQYFGTFFDLNSFWEKMFQFFLVATCAAFFVNFGYHLFYFLSYIL